MAQARFKRIRLFTNISVIGPDNVLYDEVWVYKLSTDNGTTKQKYRIRYQRTDNAMALGFEADEAEAANEMLSAFGPAVSCNLEIWTGTEWSRCIDWMGDPGASAESACNDLNEQFKAFVTCVPIDMPFVSDIIPPKPPPGSKKKIKKETKDLDDLPSDDDSSSSGSETPDFDWI